MQSIEWKCKIKFKRRLTSCYVSYYYGSLLFFKQEEEVPYLFFIEELEITGTLQTALEKLKGQDFEQATEIICQAQAVYK